MSEPAFTDRELLYAATARCKCGAGLAHPLDHQAAQRLRAWACSRVLRGEGHDEGHDLLPFAFWKVREETSVNNAGGHTTRPAGTVARTVGKATCPACQAEWQSEPYNASLDGHHWRSGPCPGCGHAVGADGSYSTRDGEPIRMRFPDVIVDGQ